MNSERKISLNQKIGSTESGTGMAVISRIKRETTALLAQNCIELQPYICDTTDFLRSELRKNHEIIIEGTQGFGLSLLHSTDYPFVTSRDTSAAAFLSETGLSPFDVKNVIMTIRAFPIRVAGNSGPLPFEISWDDITKRSGSRTSIIERTTVTNRIRRVASFSEDIVNKSIATNQPNIIVLNHCDYFDYSINNSSVISSIVEREIGNIERKIGRVDYIGTGDSTLVKR